METRKVLTIMFVALGLMVWEAREASAGTLAAWGRNNYGQCDIPAGSDFVAISAGAYHSLYLKSDDSITASGLNSKGQCDVPTENNFVAIGAGNYHSLALKSDGSLVAWGNNTYGQCNVPSGNNFVAITCGYWCSRAFKSDGSGMVWGWNQYPHSVASNEEYAAIADGGFHSLGLRFDGSLSAWGLNNYRQCDVPEGNDFVAVARGEYHSLALKSDGSAVASGLNEYQQFDVPTSADFVAVARGVYHGISAVGEPVVLVAAGTVDIAEEAVELVKIKYKELPAVFNPEESAKKKPPTIIRPERPSYVYEPLPRYPEMLDPNIPNLQTMAILRTGDVEKGFKEADLIVEIRYYCESLHTCPIETHIIDASLALMTLL